MNKNPFGIRSRKERIVSDSFIFRYSCTTLKAPEEYLLRISSVVLFFSFRVLYIAVEKVNKTCKRLLVKRL
jgi:hypothetical protein